MRFRVFVAGGIQIGPVGVIRMSSPIWHETFGDIEDRKVTRSWLIQTGLHLFKGFQLNYRRTHEIETA